MSSFLVLREGETRNRWRVMDKCVQMFDKELWRLGPDGSDVFWRVMRKYYEGGQERLLGRKKKSGQNGRKENGEETRGEDRRDGWRKGLSPEIGVKKTMNAGGVENGI
ncbi:hypothetical protein TNCV_3946761 [Trichonephila clavipes]|nr:hypothetical protein TNCV_3946761 [Trichonephila clavipes]